MTPAQTVPAGVARAVVAVRPAAALAARPRLFAALEAAFPVRFAPWVPRAGGWDGIVAVGDGARVPAAGELDDLGGVPVIAFAGGPARRAPVQDVRLGDTDGVDRRVRNLLLAGHVAGVEPAPPAPGEQPLAFAGAEPAWRRTAGPSPVDRVRAVLPELGEDEVLRDIIAADRALGPIALVHFLRRLGSGLTQAPPLRAAFMFDDPNLRWRSYGFIDYDKLLRHADRHGYHVSMAMIPLDATRAHRATADLFRRRPDRLSLVYHGNNHEKRELMQPADLPAALALTGQAVRRVTRFEAATGVHVDRVMTPPHGLCSRPVARALGAVGFDALCAIHPAPWAERAPADRPLAGWNPAHFQEGCAVVPRVPLTCPTAEMALRAFLDQPLVIYGHHEELAGGLEQLADVAATVNRLGDVRWTSIESIVLSNWALRDEGPLATVEPYGGRLRVPLPAGARQITVAAPPGGAERSGLAGWSVAADPAVYAFGDPVTAGPDLGDVRLRSRWEQAAASIPAAKPHARPMLRRLATESRDRLLPLRERALAGRSPAA